MESKPHKAGKRKRERYRVGRKKTFFDKKSKILKMSYREISVFLCLLVFFLIILFRNVILDFFISAQ